MFKGIIHRRVMAVVKRRISDAQKEYDHEVKGLHEAHWEERKALLTRLEENKEKLANQLVRKIIGHLFSEDET